MKNTFEPRLVVIDDDEAFCRLVKRVAGPYGFDVVTTSDAKEFKRAVQSWIPTLIIMDLNMPGTDGIELLRDLALNKCVAPIVLASGVDSRTLDAALRLGTERGLKMGGVLQKPVPLQDMKALLTKYRPADSTTLTRDLEQAIAGDQLFLEYQPKIDGRLGQMMGVEALVRWLHPTLGVVRPDQFIGLAEETDLIEPLTDWVFSAAAKQAAAWQQQGLTLDTISRPRICGTSSFRTDWSTIVRNLGSILIC